MEEDIIKGIKCSCGEYVAKDEAYNIDWDTNTCKECIICAFPFK